MTYRNPKGAFISRDAMLSAWLPMMLGWVLSPDAVPAALKTIAEFCVEEFRKQCRIIGQSADWKVVGSLNATGYYQECGLVEGKKWLAKRDILLKAMAEIEATDGK